MFAKLTSALLFGLSSALSANQNYAWKGSGAPLFYSNNATTFATTEHRYDFTLEEANTKVQMISNATFQLQNGQVWEEEGSQADVISCIEAFTGDKPMACSQISFDGPDESEEGHFVFFLLQEDADLSASSMEVLCSIDAKVKLNGTIIEQKKG